MPNHHLRRVQGRSNLRSTPGPVPTTTTPSLRRIPKDPNLRSSYTLVPAPLRIPKDPNLRSSYTLVPAPLRIHKATPTSTAADRSAAATARVLREAKVKEIEKAMIRGRTRAAILEAAEEMGVEW